MKTIHGFEIENGKLPVHNVMNILIAMRPKDEDFVEFDKSRQHDSDYCIKYGMLMQRKHERLVYDKMISDLKTAVE